MKEGRRLYFSEEEFALLLELAPGGEYTLFLTKQELDDRQLSAAFASLYQRGLLVREGETFSLSAAGVFFQELRNASSLVLLCRERPERKTALCYVNKHTLWLAELLGGSPAERYRLSAHRRGELAQWLTDTEFLPAPLLADEDTRELKVLFADQLELEPESGEIARLTRYTSQGKELGSYTLFPGKGCQLLRVNSPEGTELRFYTQEALRQMLRECLGG